MTGPMEPGKLLATAATCLPIGVMVAMCIAAAVAWFRRRGRR